ncbi:MAG: glycosyltransferase family 4 protein [Gemmatimonadaceae bacterium]|nr:glycosyltransferase family 4 protein [Gemmatimonadaceae bacterium]MCW5826380.1 glycosyltransferase family 4 protein [Gemmatimonadaceae bacterium]
MAIVLHVVSYYPPDRIGGVGEVVANVHRGLLARGHRSCVLTSGTSTDDANVLRVAATPLRFALAVARLATLAREADVVHLHHGEGIGLLIAMRLLRIKTPVLLTLHVNVAAMMPSMRPYRAAGRTFGDWTMAERFYATVVMPARALMDRVALALADSVSFISRSAAQDTLGADAAEGAVIIYNGLAAAATPRAEAIDSSTLLFVGSGSVRKRVESLPLVLAAVRRRLPSATLRIIGLAAGDNQELLTVADALGVRDALIFEGRRRSEELPAYYRASQVLLVPSAYEGLPMVILEAQQQGLPCVATRVSGHPEVITDGVNGYLVPLDDPEQMAAAALRVLENPEIRARMAINGQREIASRFSVARQVEEYLALYATLWNVT